MDKVYIVTVDEWLDYDHINSYLAGVCSSLEKANELKDKLVPVFEELKENGDNEAFNIDIDQAEIDLPNGWIAQLLEEED